GAKRLKPGLFESPKAGFSNRGRLFGGKTPEKNLRARNHCAPKEHLGGPFLSQCIAWRFLPQPKKQAFRLSEGSAQKARSYRVCGGQKTPSAFGKAEVFGIFFAGVCA
ncbi:MAG: hypothetical protein IKO42_06775, partial [Opitutales bacterium]|nr:hypothetical protein [Opitutales bacterium]